MITAIVMLSAPARLRAEVNAESVFRKARAYTVRVRTQVTTPFFGDKRGGCEGAGFLVDRQRGWILTNAHVVSQSPSVVHVAFCDAPFQEARKLYVDPVVDVAVLAIDEIPPGHGAAELGGGEPVQVGEPVGAFGHPLGMHFTGTRGIVSGSTDQLGPDLLQIDATVDHGNSGGPTIALRDGRVIGIATLMASGDKSDRLNFATPMKDVNRILALLREGVSPSPPVRPFALLIDEDGRSTLEVACTFDPVRWPLETGDRLLRLEGDRETFQTVNDFITAMRGRRGRVPLVVECAGRKRTVLVTPAPEPLVTDQRGVQIDGALIAPFTIPDGVSLREPALLFVHSVEPGSAAGMLDLESYDIVHTVGGRTFTDLDSLMSYLERRPEGEPLRIVIRRYSESTNRVFDYHVRDFPGEDIKRVGRGIEPVAVKQD